MNSEKVKEIKKALVQNIKSGLGYEDNDKFCNVMLADILTLINELESENERLKTSEFNSCQELENAFSQIHSLEDRIYELEYGIAKSMLGCEFLPECTDEKLKQFAKKLKEKLYNFQTWELPYDEWCKGNVVCWKIDDTLNEFLKGENNE